MEPHIDYNLQLWEAQLGRLPKSALMTGCWRLYLFNPPHSDFRGESEAFVKRQSWTAESYFTDECKEWRCTIYAANTKEELIPPNPKLLRIFGVFYLIAPSTRPIDILTTGESLDIEYPRIHQSPDLVYWNNKGEGRYYDLTKNYEADLLYELVLQEEIQVLLNRNLKTKQKQIDQFIENSKIEIDLFAKKTLEQLAAFQSQAKSPSDFAKSTSEGLSKIANYRDEKTDEIREFSRTIESEISQFEWEKDLLLENVYPYNF